MSPVSTSQAASFEMYPPRDTTAGRWYALGVEYKGTKWLRHDLDPMTHAEIVCFISKLPRDGAWSGHRYFVVEIEAEGGTR